MHISISRTFRQIFCSRAILLDVQQILVDVHQKFYWTSSRIFFSFLDEIGNSKTFEANLQNSSGRPVESCWMTSQKFYRTSSRPNDLGQYTYHRHSKHFTNQITILLSFCLVIKLYHPKQHHLKHKLLDFFSLEAILVDNREKTLLLLICCQRSQKIKRSSKSISDIRLL